jgi:hypothetical protein
MSEQIGIRGLQGLAKSTDRSTDFSMLVVVAFCLIGFLLTLNFMLRFPDMGALIAQYNLM